MGGVLRAGVVSRPPDEDTAQRLASMIHHHLQWGEWDAARERAAEAVRRGEPMVEVLRDAILAALAPKERERGRPKAPYPRHWFTIGLIYQELTYDRRMSAEAACEAIARMKKFGNISAETVRKRVQYFNREWAAVDADLQRQAEAMESDQR